MDNSTVQPRSVYVAPLHKDGQQWTPASLRYKVNLRHPGYSDNRNILMVLPALDHPGGGIHHETARIACAIISNNRWDGFLSETRDGAPVQLGPDVILRGDNYYFKVPDGNEDKIYPIVPCFAHWRFPHDNLPPSWVSSLVTENPDQLLPRQSSVTEAIIARDISCRLTNHIESTEHAHLLPRSEERWFAENGMFRYTNQQRPGSNPVDDTQNAILLRSDVHTIFDQKQFAVVPKASALVIHIVAPGSSSQLTNIYHNVQLQKLYDVAVQFLFARFAWTIFAKSINFVTQGLRRTLCILTKDEDLKIQELTGDECKQFLTTPKSRSQSPRKRTRDDLITAIEEDEADIDFQESFRGRRRQRSFDISLSGASSFDSMGWSYGTDGTQETHNTEPDESVVGKKPQIDGVGCFIKRRRLRSPGTDSLIQTG